MHLCTRSIWQKSCQAHWSDVTTASTVQTARSVSRAFRALTVITAQKKKIEQECAAKKALRRKKNRELSSRFSFQTDHISTKKQEDIFSLFFFSVSFQWFKAMLMA